MANTKSARRRKQERRNANRMATDAGAPGGPFLILSGYAAANDSPLRGAIYWPHGADTRRELNSMSDAEIRRRVHFLVGNMGMPRRIIWGLAKFLGVLRPQPVTADEKWNTAARKNFRKGACSSLSFDRAGRFNFLTGQRQMNVDRFKDGRVLPAMVQTPSGRAQVAFYEASQIRSGGEHASEFEEGIRVDRFGRHLGYCVQDARDSHEYREIPARFAKYYGNFENHGRIHGLSVLAHAVPNLTDIVELRGMRKHAAKVHSDIGVVIETDNGPAIQLQGGELLGAMYRQIQTARDTGEGDGGGSGAEAVLKEKVISWEQVAGSGGIPPLQPGQRIKVIADDRPTPNNLEFDNTLIEDCILGSDVPAAVLYYAAGKTGPSIRFDMEDVRRWTELRHMEQAEWCQWFWSIYCAKEIKAGRLAMPVDANGEPCEYWHEVEWIGQPDMTIDHGKEGNLAISRLKAGLSTWEVEWGAQGYHWEEQVKKRVMEHAKAKAWVSEAAKLYNVELSMAEVFPEFGGGTDPDGDSDSRDERREEEFEEAA